MSGSGESSSGAAGKALDRDSGAAQPDPPKDKHDAERLRVLMQGYQQGDGAATIELVERLSPMLLRFLAGPLQTRPFAEDMLQDCWLRVHKARHTYRSESPVLPWIFAIARHTRVDAYRRRRNAEGPSRRQGRTGAPSRLGDSRRWLVALLRLPTGRPAPFLLPPLGIDFFDNSISRLETNLTLFEDTAKIASNSPWRGIEAGVVEEQ